MGKFKNIDMSNIYKKIILNKEKQQQLTLQTLINFTPLLAIRESNMLTRVVSDSQSDTIIRPFYLKILTDFDLYIDLFFS